MCLNNFSIPGSLGSQFKQKKYQTISIIELTHLLGSYTALILAHTLSSINLDAVLLIFLNEDIGKTIFQVKQRGKEPIKYIIPGESYNEQFDANFFKSIRIILFQSQMRLRKKTLKTQFLQRSQQYSRFKLLKRQTSQAQYLKQKPTSSAIQQPPSTKASKNNQKLDKLSFLQKSSSCRRAFKHLFQSQPKQLNSSTPKQTQTLLTHRKKSDLSNQMNLLQNHLISIKQKNKRKHYRTSTEPNLHFESEKHQDKGKENSPMELKMFQRCCGIIDDIFQIIKLLKNIGYAEFKINQWLLHYCDNRRPYMKAIFMRNISKNFYTLEEQYQFEKDAKAIKDRIKYKIEKTSQLYYYVQVEELGELQRYLQEILLQKYNQKARQVQSSIIEKLSQDFIPRLKSKYFIFTKKQPAQIYNFLHELDQHEQRYGDFVSFSKINKHRFLQLNRVQQNLKKAYHSILNCEVNKIIKEKDPQNDQIHVVPLR